jgi:hypothetical protein
MNAFIIIGSGVEEWPPRSPELTPMDFFCGVLWRTMYTFPPLLTTLHELKTLIREAWADSDQDIIQEWQEDEYQFDIAQTTHEAHTELYQWQIIIIIRGATALMNLGRLRSRRWQSFPTAPDGTGLTCGQHIKSHSCIFSFPNRTVTSLFK